MTENDARYFAGIVDGEGWIDCRRRIKKCSNNKFYKCSSIHVEIQMNHKGVMEWLKEKAGFGTLRYTQGYVTNRILIIGDGDVLSEMPINWPKISYHLVS